VELMTRDIFINNRGTHKSEKPIDHSPLTCVSLTLAESNGHGIGAQATAY